MFCTGEGSGECRAVVPQGSHAEKASLQQSRTHLANRIQLHCSLVQHIPVCVMICCHNFSPRFDSPLQVPDLCVIIVKCFGDMSLNTYVQAVVTVI